MMLRSHHTAQCLQQARQGIKQDSPSVRWGALAFKGRPSFTSCVARGKLFLDLLTCKMVTKNPTSRFLWKISEMYLKWLSHSTNVGSVSLSIYPHLYKCYHPVFEIYITALVKNIGSKKENSKKKTFSKECTKWLTAITADS